MTQVQNAGRYLRSRMSPWAIALLALITAVAFTIPFLLADPAAADDVIPGGASGDGVVPEGVHGNPDCSDLLGAADYLFEYKTGVPTDETIPLSFNGLSGSVTVDVTGSTFDFSFSGDFVAAAVIVKGGPNANFYDYTPDGNAADTGLHAPINPSNGKFFGLSHISFCIMEAPAEIDIAKSAVDDSITIGDRAAFDITVTSLGPATALNVTIDDDLPAGFDWEIVSEQGDTGLAGTNCNIDDSVDPNELDCSVGDLASGESYTVRVQTTTDMTANECDTTLNNTAFADADNADPVDDSASIDVECGGVKVVKTAKHADTSGATSANLAATFRITDSNGDTHDVVTGATTGIACVDDLPLGAATVVELSGPSGYAADPDTENVTVTDSDCPDPGAGATASFENIPLTDVEIVIDSQQAGATSTVVECWEGSDTSGAADFWTTILGDGSLDMDDFEPTDPDVTLTCEITIDP